MPDMTPPELRSEANGIINFMGGLASVFFVLIGGSYLYAANRNLPFMATGVVMVISLVIIMRFIKEPIAYEPAEKKEKIRILKKTIGDVFAAKDQKKP